MVDVLLVGISMNSCGISGAFRCGSLRMVADFERVIALGRELGQHDLDLSGHHNHGELLGYLDRIDDAARHVARAWNMYERWASGCWRSETVLLDARIARYRGDLATAGEFALHARGEGTRALPVPVENVLCSMVELAMSDVDDVAWDALEQRAAGNNPVGQERIESLEARGLMEARMGRVDAARRHLERAAQLACEIPNLLRDRVERVLAQLPPEGSRRVGATTPERRRS